MSRQIIQALETVDKSAVEFFPRKSSTTLKSPETNVLVLLAFPVKRYLPHIILIAVLSSGLAFAYQSVILQSATSTTPKVTWTTKPLSITFSAVSGAGSATDSFTCNPSTAAIVVAVVPLTGRADILSLSVSPDSFLQCGAGALSVTVVATCLVPADSCVGTYNWLVQIRQPLRYRNLADPLQVRVTVN